MPIIGRHQDPARAALRHPRSCSRRRGRSERRRARRPAGAGGRRARAADAGRRAATRRRKTSISDVVTAADHAAERLVVDTLAVERPDDGVLGEEGASRAGTSGRTWVIDPVDGTYNFVAGLDWWCSAIALTDGDDLVLGAIHHPATGRTFVGGPGLPSTVDGAAAGPARRPAAGRVLRDDVPAPAVLRRRGRRGVRADGRAAPRRCGCSAPARWTRRRSPRAACTCSASTPSRRGTSCRAPRSSAAPEASTRTVRAAGVDWYVAGAPTAVDEVCARC